MKTEDEFVVVNWWKRSVSQEDRHRAIFHRMFFLEHSCTNLRERCAPCSLDQCKFPAPKFSILYLSLHKRTRLVNFRVVTSFAGFFYFYNSGLLCSGFSSFFFCEWMSEWKNAK